MKQKFSILPEVGDQIHKRDDTLKKNLLVIHGIEPHSLKQTF